MHLHLIGLHALRAFLLHGSDVVAKLKEIHLIKVFLDFVKVGGHQFDDGVKVTTFLKTFLFPVEITDGIGIEIPTVGAQGVVIEHISHGLVFQFTAFVFFPCKLVAVLLRNIETLHIDELVFVKHHMDIASRTLREFLHVFVLELAAYLIGLGNQEVAEIK